jgi:hypothetical protein
MNDIEKIAHAMSEVGPLEHGIFEILRLRDDFWAVRFAQVEVEVELEPAARRLVLSAEIGPVGLERQTEVYETLLMYNLLWRETGGVRMALTEPDGGVIQSVDLHFSLIEAPLLAVVLHNLNERTLMWREFFAGGVAPDASPTYPDFPLMQV